MNYFPYPYMPNPYPNLQIPNWEQELLNLKKEVKELRQGVKKLEKSEKNDYLDKDDGLYMIWTQKCSFFCWNNVIMVYY